MPGLRHRHRRRGRVDHREAVGGREVAGAGDGDQPAVTPPDQVRHGADPRHVPPGPDDGAIRGHLQQRGHRRAAARGQAHAQHVAVACGVHQHLDGGGQARCQIPPPGQRAVRCVAHQHRTGFSTGIDQAHRAGHHRVAGRVGRHGVGGFVAVGLGLVVAAGPQQGAGTVAPGQCDVATRCGAEGGAVDVVRAVQGQRNAAGGIAPEHNGVGRQGDGGRAGGGLGAHRPRGCSRGCRGGFGFISAPIAGGQQHTQAGQRCRAGQRAARTAGFRRRSHCACVERQPVGGRRHRHRPQGPAVVGLGGWAVGHVLLLKGIAPPCKPPCGPLCRTDPPPAWRTFRARLTTAGNSVTKCDRSGPVPHC